MKKEFVLNQSVCDFSRGIDIAQTILIYLVALFVPTFLGNDIKSSIWCF